MTALDRLRVVLVRLRGLVVGHSDLDIERRCTLTDALDALDKVARTQTPTPAEHLLALVREALDLPPADLDDQNAQHMRDDLLKWRVGSVLASTRAPHTAADMAFLRERIDATPVKYATKESR